MLGKRRQVKRKVGRGIFHAYAILAYAFLYIPIAIMIAFSFNDQKLNYYWKGFTFKWYEKLFTHPTMMDNLKNTLIVAVATTILSVVIGTIGAVGLTRFEFKMKKLINNSLYIPIVIPEIILGISLLMLFEILNIPLGLLAMVLAHSTFCIPFVIVTIRGSLSGFDMSLEEASMDLGANRFETFFRITLPIITPGVMSGAFLAFTLSIDDVIISNFVAGAKSTTLPVKILSLVKTGVTPEINALTTVMVLVIIVGMLLNSLLQAFLRKRGALIVKK